jgi:hypothetical protein
VVEVIGQLAWPAALLFLAYRFEPEIRSVVRAVVERGGSVGASGVTLQPSTVQTKPIEVKSLDVQSEPLSDRRFLNENAELWKQLIDKDGLTGDQKERRMLGYLARVYSDVLHFQTYLKIFGSQLELIRLLFSRRIMPISDALSIFDSARAKFELVHRTRTFSDWLAFLNNTMIKIEGENIMATDLLDDFFEFLTRHKLTDDRAG